MFMQLQERLTVLDPLSGFFKNAFFLLRAVAANIFQTPVGMVGWEWTYAGDDEIMKHRQQVVKELQVNQMRKPDKRTWWLKKCHMTTHTQKFTVQLFINLHSTLNA